MTHILFTIAHFIRANRMVAIAAPISLICNQLRPRHEGESKDFSKIKDGRLLIMNHLITFTVIDQLNQFG